MNELLQNSQAMFANISESFLSILSSGSGIDMAIKGVGAYLFAVWIAFVIWVVRDVTNRSENLIVQTFSVLLVVVFTPIFGIPLYLLMRPRATLFEQYYEEANLHEAEEFREHTCFKCHAGVSDEYRYCPECGEALLHPCPYCGEFVEESWEHCVHCGKNIKASPKGKSLTQKNPARKKKGGAKEKKGAEIPTIEPGNEEVKTPRKEETPTNSAKVRTVRIEEIPEAGK